MNLQATQAPEPPGVARVLDGDARLFREAFNRASFQFAHRLADHPLFDLPVLLELAGRMGYGDIYYNAGEMRVGQRWDATPKTSLTAEQLIERIEHAGAWLVMKPAHVDARYRAVLEQGLAEVRDLVGPAYPRAVKKIEAYLFVTSPNRVTNYHIDRDCSYLMQIRGRKTISVFDKFDREVLPEPEIERFWAKDVNAAVYKEQFQGRAKTYDLEPGTGVHLPVNAPHWVKNDANISVTLGLSFQFPDSTLANVYRTNYFLRKVGLRPLPPGKSRVRDALKTWAMGGALFARDAVRRVLRRKR